MVLQLSHGVIEFLIVVFTNEMKRKIWGTSSCINTAQTSTHNHHLQRKNQMAEAYMEKASILASPSAADPDNRDPNHLNKHLQVGGQGILT